MSHLFENVSLRRCRLEDPVELEMVFAHRRRARSTFSRSDKLKLIGFPLIRELHRCQGRVDCTLRSCIDAVVPDRGPDTAENADVASELLHLIVQLSSQALGFTQLVLKEATVLLEFLVIELE